MLIVCRAWMRSAYRSRRVKTTLAARLTSLAGCSTPPPSPRNHHPSPSAPEAKLVLHEFYQILYQACRCIKVLSLHCNRAFFKAVEFEEYPPSLLVASLGSVKVDALSRKAGTRAKILPAMYSCDGWTRRGQTETLSLPVHGAMLKQHNPKLNSGLLSR